MKLLLDTNILIACAVREHEHRQRCLPYMDGVVNGSYQGFLSSHGLLEYHRYLTSQLRPRASTQDAAAAVELLLRHFIMVCLEVEDMRAIFRRAEKYSISGGTIYDLAIAQAGIKVQVDRIVALNDRHFKLFGPDVAELLIIP